MCVCVCNSFWTYVLQRVYVGVTVVSSSRELVLTNFSLLSNISPLRKEDIRNSGPVNKANILKDQFVSLFTQEEMHNIPDKDDSPHPDLPDIIFHPDGVRILLQKINFHKATGPDNIPGELLKELHPLRDPGV